MSRVGNQFPRANRAPALPALSLLHRSARPPAPGKSLISHSFPGFSRTAFSEEKPATNSARAFPTSLASDAGSALRTQRSRGSRAPSGCPGRRQPGCPVCCQSQQAELPQHAWHGGGDRARRRSVPSPCGLSGTQRVSLLWSRPVLTLKAKVCRALGATGHWPGLPSPPGRAAAEPCCHCHCRALLSLSPAHGHRESRGQLSAALGTERADGKERG